MITALLLIAIGLIVIGFSVTVFMLCKGERKMSNFVTEEQQAAANLATIADSVIALIQTETANLQAQIATLKSTQANPDAIASIEASTAKLAALLPPPVAATTAPNGDTPASPVSGT